MPTPQDYTQARHMPITPAGSDRPADGAIQHVHDDECAPDGASEPLHPADADRALLADRIPRARRRERQREDQNRRKPPLPGCCPRGNCAGGRCGNARPKPAVGRRRLGYGSAPPVGATSRVGANANRLAAAPGPNPPCKCRKLLRQGRQRLAQQPSGARNSPDQAVLTLKPRTKTIFANFGEHGPALRNPGRPRHAEARQRKMRPSNENRQG